MRGLPAARNQPHATPANVASAASQCIQGCATPSDIAESPADSPACALRQPHLHPAQTESSRHLATARPRDVVCASVPPSSHCERAQVATKRGARLTLLPIWM